MKDRLVLKLILKMAESVPEASLTAALVIDLVHELLEAHDIIDLLTERPRCIHTVIRDAHPSGVCFICD